MTPYREFAPSGDVYSLVACRWLRQTAEDESGESVLVLPDGCVDLLWREGDVVVAGLDRNARPSRITPGERILGLRLRPGLAGALLGMPASEVLDVHVRLEELLGPAGRELAERIGESEGEEETFRVLASTGSPNRSGSATASSGGGSTGRSATGRRRSIGFCPSGAWPRSLARSRQAKAISLGWRPSLATPTRPT